MYVLELMKYGKHQVCADAISQAWTDGYTSHLSDVIISNTSADVFPKFIVSSYGYRYTVKPWWFV